MNSDSVKDVISITQAKYAPVQYTPSEIMQVKYAPAPVTPTIAPVPITTIQVKYAPAPVTPTVAPVPITTIQVKYAPAPVTPTIAPIPCPEPVPPTAELIADTYEDIYGSGAQQGQNTPPIPCPEPVPPTVELIADTYEDIYGTSTQQGQSGKSGDNEQDVNVYEATIKNSDIQDIDEYTDNLNSIINDIGTLNNNVHTVKGSFGSALNYLADNCTEKFNNLKKHSNQVLSNAIDNACKYYENRTEMKKILNIIGETNIDDDYLSIPENKMELLGSDNINLFNKLKNENENLKSEIEYLSSENI